jgi:hypothetical protein
MAKRLEIGLILMATAILAGLAGCSADAGKR